MRKKSDTDLGLLMVRNIAALMEREQEKRGLNKKQIAAMCDMTSPYYLRILDGSANPTTQMIARIANGLNVSLEELLLAKRRGPDPT
ncbi:helix-turn-helix domain-containing protein [Sinorhizobium meliloti]|uniref:helix-turn-helix domain-containing protein n=1 Tax=Rhizobium meliloti TaxID=382 RepID=UPI000316F5F4|nr:helix-turn-helix transcriptional regulator [Sinorhizobium meliloti]MDE4589258.1 helix-turn-helix transcriptional regulator [Sinorhizobium meliloti]